MDSALTAGTKKRITEDWRVFLPRMGIYKPMWLMKRNGPLGLAKTFFERFGNAAPAR